MEQNYGGPVWHVSIAPRGVAWGAPVLERQARLQLEGVGDPGLEWTDFTGRAFHLRRRLTAEEAAPIGPVVDVRGTAEAERRLAEVRHLLPAGWAS